MDPWPDEDEEVVEIPPLAFQSPRKRRVVKLKERLDDSFLRCSKRLSTELNGFKDPQVAKKATTESMPRELQLPLICPRKSWRGLQRDSSRFSLRLCRCCTSRGR